MTKHLTSILTAKIKGGGRNKGEEGNNHLYKFEIQNVPSKNELHFESIFSMSKCFLMGQKELENIFYLQT